MEKGTSIVIPYRNERHSGLELKYSLRAIEKHLRGYGEIFIIGEKPDWIKNVIHIPAQDEPCVKERNIVNKLLIACKDERVSEDFIYFNDDHFLLKELDVKDFKRWHNGSLNDVLPKAKGGYRTAVLNTLDFFGVDILNYDIHTPVIFSKEHFLYINTPQLWTRENIVKSIYCNYLRDESLDEYMDDCKLNVPMTYAAMRRKIEGRLFFSTGDLVIDGNLVQLLDELFPNKSQYE